MLAVPLTRLTPGQTATVSDIEGDFESCQRLFELGFVSGTPVRYVRRAPLGDPVEYDVAGSRFSLRHEVASRISVLVEPGL